MTTYFVPSAQEFTEGAAKRYAFLVNEFGFAAGPTPPPYEQTFAFCFWRPPVFVLVEGFSYGFALGTSVGLDSPEGQSQARIHLSFLMRKRRPELLAPRFGEARGQLEEMSFQAAALRDCAGDLIRGDLSHWKELVEEQQREEDEGRRVADAEAQRRELERVAAHAASAFHAREYQKTVALLEPHQAVLSKAQSTMLRVARSRGMNAA